MDDARVMVMRHEGMIVVGYEEFVARVREVGEYPSRDEAELATYNVLSVLGQRLTDGEVRDLAAQLPERLGDALLTANTGAPDAFGVEEFVTRVAAAVPGASEQTATWDASAVLTILAESISGGQLNQVLTQLQSGYATLFGKPELA